jgi:nucleoside-diphosphate-sugar epimerase
VIPTVITQIAAGMDRIKLGALHPTRDFTFVADMVRGFHAAAECDAAIGQVVNVGGNYEISIRDVALLIAEEMGRTIELVSDQQRLRPVASEVERLWADDSRMRSLTAWQPTYAGREGLRRGLAETIRWFSDRDNLRRYKAGLYNI